MKQLHITEPNPKNIKVDVRKLYTKTEYSKAYQISRPTIDRKIESKELTTAEINGAILIVAR